MPKIFISYRRDDSEFAVDQLYRKLASSFGADSVFMDVDTITPIIGATRRFVIPKRRRAVFDYIALGAADTSEHPSEHEWE